MSSEEWIVRSNLDIYDVYPEIVNHDNGGQFYAFDIPCMGEVLVTDRDVMMRWLRETAERLESLPPLSERAYLG